MMSEDKELTMNLTGKVARNCELNLFATISLNLLLRLITHY